MKTGMKFVVLISPVENPENVTPFSTFRLACKHIGVNYNSFNHWKKNSLNGEIVLKGYLIRRKEVIRENETA